MRQFTYFAFAALAAALTAGGCGEQGSGGGGLSPVRGKAYRPAEGILVDVYGAQDDLRGPPVTQLGPLGPDGSFTVDLSPGEYVLVARQRKSGEETGPIRDGDLKSDPVRVQVQVGRPLEVDLLAYVKAGNPKETFGERQGWKSLIAGQVVDPEGEPVPGVRVHVYDHVQMSERPKYVSARTGPDGRYEVQLPEGGTYYLCARDKYGGPPKVGDLYGRYDKGTVDPSAVIVLEGTELRGIDITVHTVW